MPRHPSGTASRTIVNAIGLAGAIAGYIVLAGLAIESDLAGLGVLAVVAVLVALFVWPAGQTLGAGLPRPAAVDDRTRAGAFLVAIIGIMLGWAVLHANTAASVPVGLLLIGISAAAGTLALYPPAPDAWRLPAGPLGAGILLVATLVVTPKFRGIEPHAYYVTMGDAMQEVVSAQAAARSDSGHYTASIDTAGYPRLRTFLANQGRLELTVTADAWRASATTPLAEGRCAAWVGGAPEPPATVPGEAACTPWPDRDLAAMGTLWLLALAVTAAGSYWLRPPGSSA